MDNFYEMRERKNWVVKNKKEKILKAEKKRDLKVKDSLEINFERQM